MSVELIYKTTSAMALDWWANAEAEREAAHQRRKAYVERMTAEFGPTPPRYSYSEDKPRVLRELMVAGPSAVGLASGFSEVPPIDSGWRLDSKERFWAPKLATAAGKLRRAELHSLRSFDHRAHGSEIGFAAIAFAGSYLYHGGLEMIDGALFQTWGGYECHTECETAQAKVPGVVWEVVKRSEWYAMQESREAAEVAS